MMTLAEMISRLKRMQLLNQTKLKESNLARISYPNQLKLRLQNQLPMRFLENPSTLPSNQ